jgi:nitrilase
MVVDAWGKILAECGDAPGIAVATLDGDELDALRSAFPALDHRRL